MYSWIRVSFIGALTLLTGCASIVQGSSEKVQVATNPPSQSTCSVANSLASTTVNSPSQVVVKRSKTDLLVNCVDRTSGYAGSQAVESSLEPWLLGNILFGGIIGAPIDFGTGAAWQYPQEITIALKPTYQPETSAVPVAPMATYAAPTPTMYVPSATYVPPASPAPAAAPFQQSQPYQSPSH